MRTTPIACAALLLAGAASAHDTWFELRHTATGATTLALGTGNQFPKFETGIGAEYLAAQGCLVASGANGARVQPLKALGNDDSALLLRPPRGASSCWMQLQPFEVTVPPDKVPVYLKEIQASPEIRATWAAMQARGLPWRERYVKHARIELDGATGTTTRTTTVTTTRPAAQAAARQPTLGMDLRLARDATQPLRQGDSLRAQVLRDGQPLPGQALELRSEDSPLGIWRRSDEQGWVTLPLPLAGRWVLRGVDLRVSASRPDEWDSRFVTLAFEVQPAAAATASPSSLAAAPQP